MVSKLFNDILRGYNNDNKLDFLYTCWKDEIPHQKLYEGIENLTQIQINSPVWICLYTSEFYACEITPVTNSKIFTAAIPS